MANWWDEAPIVQPAPAPSDDDWWKNAPVVSPDGRGPPSLPPTAAARPEVDALTASTLAGGNTLTFGFGDEIGAALFSPLEAAIGAYTGEDDGKGILERLSAGYDRGLEKRRDLSTAAQEQNPTASIIGAIGGGLAPAGALSKADDVVRGALGLSEGLAGRAASSALTGAGFGAVQGFGEGEGGFQERIRDAAIGGGLGAAIGGGIPIAAAGVGAAVRGGKQALTNGPIPYRAQRMIEQDLAGEGSTLAEAGARARSLGPQAMLADTSETLRLRAEQIAQSDNPGRAGVIAAMKDRGAGAKGRLNSAYNESLGQTPDVQATLDDLLATRSAAAKPLYDEALSRTVIWDERLGAFLKDPIVKKSLARGVELQRLDALADDVPFHPNDIAITGFDDAGEPILGAVPNFKTLNVVKKGLDALVDDNKTEFGKLTQRGVAIDKVRAAFLSKLDEINPDYAAARSAWAGPSQAIKAFEGGRELLASKVHPDTLKRDFGRMSQGEKEAFQLGARASVDEAMGRVKNGALKGRQLLDTDFNERKLRTILGDDEASKLISALDGEEQMAATANQALANSATARRSDNPFRKRDDPLTVPQSLVHAGMMGVRKGVNMVLQGGVDRVAAALGPTLTARGPERDAVIEALLAASARRGQIAEGDPARRALTEALLRGGALAGGYGVNR